MASRVVPISTADEAPPGRILLVDDEPTLLRSMKRRLQADAFEVVACADGREAVRAIQSGSFDAIVSDIAMPNLSGIELLRIARNADLDLPVILVTGAPAVESAVEAINLGAFKYLTKPVDGDKLAATVRQAVQLYRLAAAKQEALALNGGYLGWTSDRIGLGAVLDQAIEHLWPAFQPIVSAKDGSLFAYEALLRSDETALPHPGAILDAAERLGKLEVLGRTMRDRSCRKMIEVGSSVQLFLNLHPHDLLDVELLNPTSATCAWASRIVLEVTERSTLDKVPRVRERVATLREAGYRIAIDDLGAGYAGLTSFVHLEPEFVKLDMALIRDVDTTPVKRRLVRAMTELAQDMGLLVVAEGIETAEERQAVVELGCDLLQGYRFGKPSREPQAPLW